MRKAIVVIRTWLMHTLRANRVHDFEVNFWTMINADE